MDKINLVYFCTQIGTYLPTFIKYLRNKQTKYVMNLKIPLQFLTEVLQWILGDKLPPKTNIINKDYEHSFAYTVFVPKFRVLYP